MPLPHRKAPPGGGRSELLPVAGMALPHALHRQPLAGSGERQTAHHRDRLVAAHVQPEDGIAVLLVLEYQVFDSARELQLVRSPE